MGFDDISARLKSRKEAQQAATPQAKPMDFSESYRIRAKMVGVLLHDARMNAARSVEDCARLLHVTSQQIEAWEFGDIVPSLPQLELLAYYLDVPVSHFWGTQTLEEDRHTVTSAQDEYLALRDRMVGALLRKAREDNSISIEDLSSSSGIPVATILHYELGELSLPMHELSVLASGVKKNMAYFLEGSSHVGEWLSQQEQWKHFADMSQELREFAASPKNVGYIEIAHMLSKMPTDKLRVIGESFLDITM